MGFHICEYCKSNPHTSSGDVTLLFDSGRGWQMPDMIIHYVRDHNWLPPNQFIQDVMHSTYIGGRRDQTKELIRVTSVGYLSGEFPKNTKGEIPANFVSRLSALMDQAARDNNRRQTRSLGCWE